MVLVGAPHGEVKGTMSEIVKPKILVLDIETFPNIGYIWGKYDQNVIRYTQQSCIATFVAKWLGDKKIISKALPDYAGYAAGSYDDKLIVADLWKLFDEADIIIAHNGDQFDIKVVVGRFLIHNMCPPRPFKTIDTKKLVKEVARYNSNSLDDLCGLLFGSHKIKTDFDLWEGCINGDRICWKNMVEYNKKDVLLLEKLYLRLMPFAKTHPNLTFWTRGTCPKCGGHNVHYRGVQRCITRQYQRFQCTDCGSWGRVAKSDKSGSVTTVNAS
jgi:DNA polymerase elongation subunit (family B)